MSVKKPVISKETAQKLLPNETAPPEDAVIVKPLSAANVSFNGGIFIIAFFTALYFMHPVVIPLMAAFFLKLVFQPIMNLLEKIKLPRVVAAFLIVAAIVGCLGGLGSMLASPASNWAQQLPNALPKLQDRLAFVSHPIQETQKLITRAEEMTRTVGPRVMAVTVQGERLSDKVMHGTGAMATGIFATLLMLFFLLASGDTFLRRLVEILPRFQDKRSAVDISQQIQQDISIYLLTISVMNMAVGILTMGVMRFYKFEDALLWGTAAFFLNYIPIIGPIIGVALFAVVGLMTTSHIDIALQPAIAYAFIHLIESNIVTPRLLARRFTLNPVLVILSLMFWHWMWGVAGAILAVPMLAVAKIVCSRIPTLAPVGHFIEG